MRNIFILIICLAEWHSYAQNVGIGILKPLSKLHVAGDIRVETLAKSNDSGLVIYNQVGVLKPLKFSGDKNDVLRGDGSFSSAANTNSWSLTGNTGIDPAVNFIGTTDHQPLRFRVFNVPAGEINANNGCTSFGIVSLEVNSEGQNNVGFGTFTLNANKNGSNNSAVGSAALSRNIGGYNNTAVGTGALGNTTTSDWNTGLGAFALSNLTGGNSNTAVGDKSLIAMTNGNANTAIGASALGNSVSAESNTAIGSYAMVSLNTGFNNVAIGSSALGNSTNVSELVAIGYNSLMNNVQGLHNQAVGSYVLAENTSGNYNTGEGYGALRKNTTGSFNTALGSRALFSNTVASRNTAIGFEALCYNTVGASNVSIGSRSMRLNKYGHSTVSIGDSAMLNNYSGNYNTGIGERVMLRNSSGSGNAALGFEALGFNTSGNNNTGLGNGADVTSGTFTNATAIGYNAKVNASNKVRIGNAAVTKIEGQVPFTTPSDGRYKYNIKEDVTGLAFIMRLRPVTYQFDVHKFDNVNDAGLLKPTQVAYQKAELLRRTGFIAQEVEAAAKASGYIFSGINIPENTNEHYSLSYESFVVPIVKAMQEQQESIKHHELLIQKQSDLIQQLKENIDIQQGMITYLQKQISTLVKLQKSHSHPIDK